MADHVELRYGEAGGEFVSVLGENLLEDRIVVEMLDLAIRDRPRINRMNRTNDEVERKLPQRTPDVAFDLVHVIDLDTGEESITARPPIGDLSEIARLVKVLPGTADRQKIVVLGKTDAVGNTRIDPCGIRRHRVFAIRAIGRVDVAVEAAFAVHAAILQAATSSPLTS